MSAVVLLIASLALAWLARPRTGWSGEQAAGTPGEVGTPRVSMPEPAFTSSESAWPW